jgi:hypothetical protein
MCATRRLGKRVAQLSSARMNEMCGTALLSGLRWKLVAPGSVALVVWAETLVESSGVACCARSAGAISIPSWARTTSRNSIESLCVQVAKR